MEIRSPDKTHLPALFALLRRCFSGGWSDEEAADRIFYDQRYDPNHVWMAREEGRVLGFAAAVLDGERSWLKMLAVDPDARRRGIGTDLLGRAEFRLAGEGAVELRVGPTPPHEFLPGPEPGSGEAAFFAARGYEALEPGAVRWLPPLEGRPAPEPLDDAGRAAAFAWARLRCPEHLGWVEDALSCRPARAVFDPGVGLCLAEPGRSLGPLWAPAPVEPPRLKDFAGSAWALASSKPASHPLGLRLWDVPGSGPLPAGRAQVRPYQPFRKALR